MKKVNKLSKLNDIIEPNLDIPPMPKQEEDDINECIIFSKIIDDNMILAKNRDRRDYVPHISIIRELHGDVEICFIKDEDTSWCEGCNSAGIGIVNTALSVGRDEEENKIIKVTGKKSKDGARMKQALKFTNIEDVVESIRTYMGGLVGHTLISDGNTVYTVELVSESEAIVKKRETEEPVVRTNHGYDFNDAGYTRGESFLSSVFRREQMLDNVDALEKISNIFNALSKSKFGKHNPYNVKRDTVDMATTSQMHLNLHKKEMHFKPLDGKCILYGVYDFLPDGYEPQIKVFTYDKGNKKEY